MDVKLQAVSTTLGPQDTDFTGANRKGSADGDHHRTIVEKRIPDEDGAEYIEKAKQFNELSDFFFGDGAQLAEPLKALGIGRPRLYVRVFDND